MSIMDVFTKALEEDPEGACALMDQVAAGIIHEQVTKHLPEIVDAYVEVVDREIRISKAALGKAYVAKASEGVYPDETYTRTAQHLAGMEAWLTEVAKAGGYEFISWTDDEGNQRRQQVRRDALGRFARINATRSVVNTNVSDMPEERLAPGVKARVSDQGGTWRANDPREEKRLNAAQGRYEQMQGLAQNWAKQLGGSAGQAQILLSMEGGGKRTVDLGDLADGDIDEDLAQQMYKIKGMKLVARSEASDEQAWDIARMNASSMSDKLVGALFGRQPGAGGRSRLEQAGQVRGNASRLEVLLDRIGVAGSALAEIDPTMKVARMATLVGAFGPEAARVMEPHVKRAAYRYRGTERTPDPEIIAMVEDADLKGAGELIDADKTSLELIAMGIKDSPENRADPVKMSVKLRGEREPDADEWSGDQTELAVRSDVAALELLKTLPRKGIVSELSEASGHILPSQGVLIDADGDVVSQSVGFSDDHYLPFNLSNLARVRGGQYVRTRVQGGLTGEDIYAAVFNGARSATVASSSGVFRIEFAPDFRGARGSSDKAFAMYDRYLKILDTLQKGKVYQLDIDAAEKRKIEDQVRRQNPKDTGAAIQVKIDDALDKKRSELMGVSQKDVDELKVKVNEVLDRDFPRATGQERARLFNDIFDEQYEALSEAKIRRLNLNGQGYATALETLQAQFPYFIRRVEFEPLRGKKDGEGWSKGQEGKGFFAARGRSYSDGPKQSRGKDRGYLSPGTLSAAEVKDYRDAKESEIRNPVPVSAPTTGTGGAQEPGTTATGTGTQRAPSTPSVTVDDSSPAARIAVVNGRLKENDRQQLVGEFVSEMQRVFSESQAGLESEKLVNPIGKLSYDELVAKYPVKDAAGNYPPINRQSQLAWLLDRETPDELNAAMTEHLDNFLEVLNHASTQDIVAGASKVWGAQGFEDLVGQSNPFGATTKDEVAAEIKRRALDLAEFELLTRTFVDPTDEAIREITGHAISYPDIVDLPDADAVKAFAAENTDVSEVAEKLGVDEDGQYLNSVAVSRRMGAVRDALSGLEQQAKDWQEAGTDEEKDKIRSAYRVSRQYPAMKDLEVIGGITSEQIDAAFSDDPPDLGELWNRLQRARTFLEVARAHGAVPDAKVGGVRPKAGAWWIPEKEPARKAAPRSPREVRVLSPQDPVSKAVAARIRDGRPWVPRRLSRR